MTTTEATPEPNAETPAEKTEAIDAAALPWADVQAEHFKMLRLAPLTTDRATGLRPLRFVQFGYAERQDKVRSLLRMRITRPGQRVRKDALRVDASGTVDEANAAIGLLRLHTVGDPASDAMLSRIQNELFDVGADLCVPGEAGARLRV